MVCCCPDDTVRERTGNIVGEATQDVSAVVALVTAAHDDGNRERTSPTCWLIRTHIGQI